MDKINFLDMMNKHFNGVLATVVEDTNKIMSDVLNPENKKLDKLVVWLSENSEDIGDRFVVDYRKLLNEINKLKS